MLVTTGTISLSDILTPTQPPQPPQIRPWWEQFVTTEFIVVLVFIPLVGLIAVAGYLYNCCTNSDDKTKNTTQKSKYRPVNVGKFGFLTFNTMTDIAFACLVGVCNSNTSWKEVRY